jgi:phosphohistidine swiveling domain-containing protein
MKRKRETVFMLIPFESVTNSDVYLGGKAQTLGLLIQKGFRVPPGVILTSPEGLDKCWSDLMDWWDKQGNCPVAVRSSAAGEDSKEFSFAGQNTTYLNVQTEEMLYQSIESCFQSIYKKNAVAYKEHLTNHKDNEGMNVVVQVMVEPQYSGVFFSQDPREKMDGWLLEAIEGLGEDLVSGKKTPEKYFQDKAEKNKLLSQKQVDEVVKIGREVAESLDYEVDMEWSIDFKGRLFVLQARPITTKFNQPSRGKSIDEELNHLRKNYDVDTVWDGQTFSEWTGHAAPLTFSIWERAFSPGGAFGEALKTLGYMSFVDKSFSPHQSILDSVFGHAYINLEKLGPLFFGPIPYEIVTYPRVHLKFNWKKITLISILRTPLSLWKMLKVAWKMSTNRNAWIQKGRKELTDFKQKLARPNTPNMYSKWEDDKLLKRFKDECKVFSDDVLQWPFILIFLIESTLSSLTAILKGVLGEAKAKEKIKLWMSVGLNTTTMEMNRYYKKVCARPELRPFFMARYGHRGTGELDLTIPRWIEKKDSTFYDATEEEYKTYKEKLEKSHNSVEDDIEGMETFKRSIILQEWRLLKKMLELRERWKMELLRPYAHIRFIALELGKRMELGEDIFWLSVDEVLQIENCRPNEKTKALIESRKKKYDAFDKIRLPQIITLNEIDNIFSNKLSTDTVFEGEALSSGIVKGKAMIVKEISKVDLAAVDEDTILVAEATDPGWTPLFTKVKGIVVEKGGVLSHCAIVAREMKVPAVSGIDQCHNRFKDGDVLWVDGENGRVSKLS